MMRQPALISLIYIISGIIMLPLNSFLTVLQRTKRDQSGISMLPLIAINQLTSRHKGEQANAKMWKETHTDSIRSPARTHGSNFSSQAYW